MRIVLARHRRGVVAALLALAVAAALSALRPPAPPTAQVHVARRDLPAGHRLSAADLAPVAWSRSALPAGLLSQPAGRVLAAPLRRGEPVTDVRVTVGGERPGRVEGIPTGRLVMAVRLTDPASAQLVEPGDHVQVIAGAPLDPLSGSSTATARVVVRDALVLNGTSAPSDGSASDRGSASGRDGLLGAFGSFGTASDAGASAGTTNGTSEGLPAGVLALAVRPDDALDLAAVTGTRTLTVARQVPTRG